MIPELVQRLTFFANRELVFGLILILLLLDIFDIFSDSARSVDLVIRTLVVAGTGYLIISAGLPLI